MGILFYADLFEKLLRVLTDVIASLYAYHR